MNTVKNSNVPWSNEVEFSGGPCDGKCDYLPDLYEIDAPDGTEVVSLFPDGRSHYQRTDRVTSNGRTVFQYTWSPSNN